MSTEPFIGEVKLFGFNFSPRGYDFCKGQTYSIAQNSALFSLLGTTYGGNGTTTFMLPNLQGRVPVGQGNGAGIGLETIGEMGGAGTATLDLNNMPAHNHTVLPMTVAIKASNDPADENSASGLFPGVAGASVYAASASPGVYTGGTEVSGATDPQGGGQPFSVMNPYLVMNYCIATTGIFPSRN